MTVTAGVAAPRRAAPRGLFGAALAISVALNLCFVAGALWSRHNAPPLVTASERFRALEAALELNDDQRAAYQAYVAATLARSARLRQEIDPLLDSAWVEMAKPRPDDAYLMQRFDEASIQWRKFQHEGVDATLALLTRLSPEQREKFVADERRRRATAKHRRLEEAR